MMKTAVTAGACLAAMIFSAAALGDVSTMKIHDLKCEYLENPIGIDDVNPRLSWKLSSSRRGEMQSAYHILVASSADILKQDRGDLWDSGLVESSQSIQVEYDGARLTSRTDCYWKVACRDSRGDMTNYSKPASFSIGLLNNSDWSAKWIAMDPALYKSETYKQDSTPVPWFRKAFNIDGAVKKATIYVSARGLFEVYTNGERIGEDVFAPEWTDYFKRVHYRSYDVTSLLKRGENALGAVVGEGWYSGHIGWRRDRGFYGLVNSVIVQLEVTLADGRKQTIVSDGSWKCSYGPIIYSDFMDGEYYDARLEMPGWCNASYNDSGWDMATVVDAPSIEMVSQPSQPVKVTGEVRPVEITEPSKGTYVVNLGQNIAGWARLKVRGKKGTVITLRFGERLNPSGSVYTTNLRAAKVIDTYVLKGEGVEVFEPRFTFHGFQYVELVGMPEKPTKDSITGIVVHSATPKTGTFACSDDMVNKLVSNIDWGQRGNFISVPTDCPQRDERLGWMGDAQIFVRTATYNRDVSAFFKKWMHDVEDGQSAEGAFADFSPRIANDGRPFEAAPGWGDAGIIVPWTIWRMYGDTKIIEEHFDAMAKWLDFMKKDNPNLVRRNHLNNNYGDWLSIKADTPKDLLATAYWAYDAKLLAEMAAAIGRDSDAVKYENLFNDVRAAFQREFVAEDGRVYNVTGHDLKKQGFDASGTERVESIGETQTNYVLALYMDLLPAELREKAAEHLVRKIKEKDWHLSTGFIGVRHLCPVLTEAGRKDIAYRLLLNDTFPSWGYSIKHGATTIWERWDGWTEHKGFQDPGMNSFNHYSLGSVGEWLYSSVAGIELDDNENAFKRFVVKPYPDDRLDFANASFESMHGLIESSWKRTSAAFEMKVTVPANTSAIIHVPVEGSASVTEGGKPAREAEGLGFIRSEDGYEVYTAGSGSYSFSVK